MLSVLLPHTYQSQDHTLWSDSTPSWWRYKGGAVMASLDWAPTYSIVFGCHAVAGWCGLAPSDAPCWDPMSCPSRHRLVLWIKYVSFSFNSHPSCSLFTVLYPNQINFLHLRTFFFSLYFYYIDIKIISICEMYFSQKIKIEFELVIYIMHFQNLLQICIKSC